MNSPTIEIYTDGSCNSQYNNGAWASIILLKDEKIILKGAEGNTTHNRMELLAVIESVKFCDENQFTGPFIVYSDSQYVCRIPERKEKLKQNKFLTNKGNPLQNTDLVQALIQQIESHSIQFIKVKAHQKATSNTSLYNNQVDKLSRQIVRNNTKGNTRI